jgi:hypothetical protein
LTVSIVSIVAFVAGGLLVAAGVVKLARPLATARAMYAAGLPGGSTIVRVLGLAEVVVGVWFLAAPSPWTGAGLAVMYLAFAGFIGFLLIARPGTASCGCAGAGDVPPSAIHVLLNALAAAAAVGAALDPPASLVGTLSSLGAASVPFAIGLVTAAYLAAVAVTDLPPALAAYRRPQGHPVETDRNRHLRADAALASARVGPGHASLWPGATPVDPQAPSPIPGATEPDA